MPASRCHGQSAQDPGARVCHRVDPRVQVDDAGGDPGIVDGQRTVLSGSAVPGRAWRYRVEPVGACVHLERGGAACAKHDVPGGQAPGAVARYGRRPAGQVRIGGGVHRAGPGHAWYRARRVCQLDVVHRDLALSGADRRVGHPEGDGVRPRGEVQVHVLVRPEQPVQRRRVADERPGAGVDPQDLLRDRAGLVPVVHRHQVPPGGGDADGEGHPATRLVDGADVLAACGGVAVVVGLRSLAVDGGVGQRRVRREVGLGPCGRRRVTDAFGRG